MIYLYLDCEIVEGNKFLLRISALHEESLFLDPSSDSFVLAQDPLEL